MTETRIGVRQNDLEHEFNLSKIRGVLRAERDKLPRDQWWKRGVTIFWSQEAAEEFRTKMRAKKAAKSARESSTPEPLPAESVAIVEPEPVAVIEEPAPPAAEEWNGLTLRALKVCRNPSFVLCDIGGEKVAVKTKKGMSHKLPGKKIKVHVEMIDGQAHYTHQR